MELEHYKEMNRNSEAELKRVFEEEMEKRNQTDTEMSEQLEEKRKEALESRVDRDRFKGKLSLNLQSDHSSEIERTREGSL